MNGKVGVVNMDGQFVKRHAGSYDNGAGRPLTNRDGRVKLTFGFRENK
jgi:hypothetical protein